MGSDVYYADVCNYHLTLDVCIPEMEISTPGDVYTNTISWGPPPDVDE